MGLQNADVDRVTPVGINSFLSGMQVGFLQVHMSEVNKGFLLLSQRTP